jgi:FtsH-binding integral membrane protein
VPESSKEERFQENTMTPLIKVFAWSTCSVAIATVLVAVAALVTPSTAQAQVLEVPEPAVLLLFGAGLLAVAFRVRSRRPQGSPDRSSR